MSTFCEDIFVDLAFIPLTLQGLKNEALFLSNKLLLTNGKIWENDLSVWINYLRKNLSLNCHQAVRLSSSVSMGLHFTDDATILEMNSVWRNKSEKTDVLSFPILDQEMNYPIDECVEIGDIVISVQTALLQAKEYNHSLELELKWLVTHGLLHLLGWDHQTSSKLEKMLALQKQLLTINGNVCSSSEKNRED